MFLRTLLTAASLAVTTASASSDAILLDSHLTSHLLSPPHEAVVLAKRQEEDIATEPFILVATPPENLFEWNEETNAACTDALSKLDLATNPSGNSVCYNIAAIDTNTGAFLADLRLYKVSDARDQFADIAPERMQVGVAYQGATVSQTMENAAVAEAAMQATANTAGGTGKNDPTLVKRSDPQLLRTFTFLGQLDEAEMKKNDPMTLPTLEALLIPIVSLTSTSLSGESMSTNISTSEAAFLVGVFSDAAVLSDMARAQLAVDELVDGLKSGTIVFQVPGIRIMIFPIALVIMSVWSLIFVAFVGWGTWERMRYREQFRRRTAMVSKGNLGTM